MINLLINFNLKIMIIKKTSRPQPLLSSANLTGWQWIKTESRKRQSNMRNERNPEKLTEKMSRKLI